MASASGTSRWTRYFTVTSALSMVALHGALLFDVSPRTTVIIGLFGAVLPMVFGMAYLLLPSYVGRTLSTRRLPGIHFATAYIGTGMLGANELIGGRAPFTALGGFLWSLGVAIFVGTLLWTVVPAVRTTPEIVLRSGDRPQRSTRLATMLIPVAIGYLVVGTVALLSMTTPLPSVVGDSLPIVVHYYAAGFAALLIFTLGARLLTGFFHESPPRYLTWFVLLCGAVAPGVLALNFWHPPWFFVGAGLEFLAMVGYAGLVGIVTYRTERRRVGLYGIVFGALSGAVAVGAATLAVLGVDTTNLVGVHVDVILTGFFLLTIIGYAYQFFPVTNGQFLGATERTALTTLLLLVFGVGLQAISAFTAYSWFHVAGNSLAVVGTTGYTYLMARRLLD